MSYGEYYRTESSPLKSPNTTTSRCTSSTGAFRGALSSAIFAIKVYAGLGDVWWHVNSVREMQSTLLTKMFANGDYSSER